MAFNEQQQVFELVKKSRRILIIMKTDWTGDAIASSLALREFFSQLGHKADIVCQNYKPSVNLSYLPLSVINATLDSLQKFVISVDLSATGLAEFEFDQTDNKINFHLSPKSGQLSPENISSDVSGYKYDLIFLINTPDLDSLGEAYAKHADFFYATPKINIDHNPQNEHFGNINLVNIAASSTAEIVYDLICDYDEKLVDNNIATYVLSGMISGTKNFKTTNVTPKTLNLAGLLINKGARRDQIIQSLYQSRFLTTLKLWGRVLSRLNNDLNDRLIWSALSLVDFVETSTDSDELPDVVEELILSMPKTEVIILFFEEQRLESVDIKVLIYTVKNRDAIFISRKFNPQGNKDVARFLMAGVTLAEAERQVIEEIKNELD